MAKRADAKSGEGGTDAKSKCQSRGEREREWWMRESESGEFEATMVVVGDKSGRGQKLGRVIAILGRPASVYTEGGTALEEVAAQTLGTGLLKRRSQKILTEEDL